jgi:hypothetical protein
MEGVSDLVSVGAVEVGDDVRGGFHPLISRPTQRACTVDVAHSIALARRHERDTR